jgi:hypothetical protein
MRRGSFVTALIRRARDGNPDELIGWLEQEGEMTGELYQYLAGVLSGKERRPSWRPRRNKSAAILVDLIDWPTWDKNTAKDVAKKHGVSVATVNRLTAEAKKSRRRGVKPLEPRLRELMEANLPPDPDEAREQLRDMLCLAYELWYEPRKLVNKSRT